MENAQLFTIGVMINHGEVTILATGGVRPRPTWGPSPVSVQQVAPWTNHVPSLRWTVTVAAPSCNSVDFPFTAGDWAQPLATSWWFILWAASPTSHTSPSVCHIYYLEEPFVSCKQRLWSSMSQAESWVTSWSASLTALDKHAYLPTLHGFSLCGYFCFSLWHLLVHFIHVFWQGCVVCLSRMETTF